MPLRHDGGRGLSQSTIVTTVAQSTVRLVIITIVATQHRRVAVAPRQFAPKHLEARASEAHARRACQADVLAARLQTIGVARPTTDDGPHLDGSNGARASLGRPVVASCGTTAKTATSDHAAATTASASHAAPSTSRANGGSAVVALTHFFRHRSS